MLRLVLGWVLVPLTLTALSVGAHAADCWLLKGAKLEAVQKRGECKDAFAPNADRKSATAKVSPKPRIASQGKAGARGRQSSSKGVSVPKIEIPRPAFLPDHRNYGANGPRVDR